MVLAAVHGESCLGLWPKLVLWSSNQPKPVWGTDREGRGCARRGATGSPGQPRSPSEVTGFRGQCKHLVISLVAFLRMAVSCAVGKSSFVFLECSL